MSGLKLNSIQSSENEFIAEESIIEIISSFDHPQFKFVSGIFGPFVSQMPCRVPLWLALSFKKKGKCTIVAPSWMTVEELERTVSNERTQKVLGHLPFHYMEIAHLLLANAREDIDSPDQVAVLLQDVESVRMDRIKTGISAIAAAVSTNESVISANLNNVAAMEIYSIKRFFLSSLDMFFRFIPPPEAEADEEDDSFQSPPAATTGLRKFRDI